MGTWQSVLDPADMQEPLSEVYLLPLEMTQLRSSQAMTVGHQDHGGVTVAVTAPFPGDVDQVVDFAVGEVLALSSVAVSLSFWRECPIFTVWGHGFGEG